MEKQIETSFSPFFSVIVPVYNVGEFVDRGLHSLAIQKFQDFEVLVIDDGSSDNSGSICDRYQQIDHRFRVFHKDNGGASTARNLGLENARGKWVAYMDPDDWVDDEFLKRFAELSNDSYQLLSQGYKITETSTNKTTKVFEEEGIYEGKNIVSLFEKMLYSGQFGYLWCKAFRRDIIEKYNIRYDVKLRRMQDVDWIAQYCRYVICVNNSSDCYYNYYWVGQGFHRPGHHKLYSWCKVYESFCNLKAGSMAVKGKDFFINELTISLLKEKGVVPNKTIREICCWLSGNLYESRSVLEKSASGTVRLFYKLAIFNSNQYLYLQFIVFRKLQRLGLLIHNLK